MASKHPQGKRNAVCGHLWPKAERGCSVQGNHLLGGGQHRVCLVCGNAAARLPHEFRAEARAHFGQQHPQPVSMKPLHAGLYGLAVTGALLDDGNEDVEERYRRIQAEQEAKNIGAVIGLVAGVAMVLTQDEQSSTEQQWTEDQQAEQTQQQTM